MTKLDQHFINIDACPPGREWVSTNCTTAAECWEKLLAEMRVEWAIWWYVRDRGFDARAEKLARRMVLRAVGYAANAMDAAKLPEQAKTLRAIPVTATFEEIERSALAAARDAWAAGDAVWAAWAAARDAARAAGAARAAAKAAAGAAGAAAKAAAGAAGAAGAAVAAAAAAGAAVAAAAAVRVAVWAAEQKQQIADIRELFECPWTEETT
jgi:hypothetical protein